VFFEHQAPDWPATRKEWKAREEGVSPHVFGNKVVVDQLVFETARSLYPGFQTYSSWTWDDLSEAAKLYNVVTLERGQDQYVDSWNRRNVPNVPVEALRDHWKKTRIFFEQNVESSAHVLFKDLTSQPHATLGRVLDALGLSAASQIVDECVRVAPKANRVYPQENIVPRV
jgi:hypothetical protein